MNTITKIFVDMDGVLANFVEGVESAKYLNGPFEKQSDYDQRKVELSNAGLFFDLPPMNDMRTLVDYVKSTGIDWEILSCSGEQNRDKVAKDKFKWIRKHVDIDVLVTCTLKGKEKAVFARPGHVLIDDKPSNITAWQKAGGIGIYHVCASRTIDHFKKLTASS
jgi:hypothetical protein|tara:strand:+ start:284 stop:775 length:492 start_codon:yes stop_codon:yes gene_type:complete